MIELSETKLTHTMTNLLKRSNLLLIVLGCELFAAQNDQQKI